MRELDGAVNASGDMKQLVLAKRDQLASIMSTLTVELTDANSVANQANNSVMSSLQVCTLVI